MEQRNELLKKMRMTERQKKGDVQHLLARSFSTRQMSTPQNNLVPSSPPGEISIPVPQFPRVHFNQPPSQASGDISLTDVTVEPRVSNHTTIPLTTITEEAGIDTVGQLVEKELKLLG